MSIFNSKYYLLLKKIESCHIRQLKKYKYKLRKSSFKAFNNIAGKINIIQQNKYYFICMF